MQTINNLLGGSGGMILYFVVIIAVFYFLLIRPQKKREKEAKNMMESLKKGDIEGYFKGVEGSGNSSEYNLQNIYPCCSASERSISLALTMAKKFGAKVVRVHGGGFAGTVQAYVPMEDAEGFVKLLEGVFGEGSCYLLKIRLSGAVRVF